jgi:hypothetical protein
LPGAGSLNPAGPDKASRDNGFIRHSPISYRSLMLPPPINSAIAALAVVWCLVGCAGDAPACPLGPYQASPRFWHPLIRSRHFIDGSLGSPLLTMPAHACRDHRPGVSAMLITSALDRSSLPAQLGTPLAPRAERQSKRMQAWQEPHRPGNSQLRSISQSHCYPS